VGELRKAILQLAVQGKLVRQDPNDEPAAVLLGKIKAEKERLVKEGKIKKVKTLAKSDSKENHFNVPNGWEWVKCRDLFTFITSGSRGWAKYYSNQGAIFLRIGNLDYNSIALDLTKIQRVEPPKSAEGTRTKVKTGDILVSITGDTGMVALIQENLEDAYINQHIALGRPSTKLNAKYIALFLTSQVALTQLQEAQRGIKNSLGLEDIRNISTPLPPFDEQRRIVAKVDQLMALCDDLESKLAQSQTDGEKLMESVVHQLVAA
jgi:type I restriction enzyme S subunit